MPDNLFNLKNQALALIEQTASTEELNQLRVNLLGRKSELNRLSKTLGKLPQEQKANLGREINEAKNTISTALDEKQKQLSGQAASKWIDITAPGKQPPVGHLHPITLAIEEIQRIFGLDMKVEFENVENIQSGPSGKMKKIVSLVAANKWASNHKETSE